MTDETHPWQDFPPAIRAMIGIFVLQARLEADIDEASMDQPLSKAERHLLISLQKPSRMGKLASEMHCLPSSLTALADAMEAQGLIRRGRDPADRRASLLSLTEDGEVKRQEIVERASHAFAETSGLSGEEIEQLSKLMDKAHLNILETGFPKGLKK